MSQFISSIEEDPFNFYLLIFFLLGGVNSILFPYNLPFSLLNGVVLYKLYRGCSFKKYTEWYLKYIFYIFILLLFLKVLYHSPINSHISTIYELLYFRLLLLLNGVSLLFFSVRIYLNLMQGEITEDRNRIILIVQLSTICLFFGFLMFYMLLNPTKFTDIEVSFFYLVVVKTIITFVLIGFYFAHSFKQAGTSGKQKERGRILTLNHDEIIEITQSLYEQIEENKLYLRTDLSLDVLADKVKVPTYKLSQYFNHYLGKSFYEYLGEYRIEYASENIELVKNDYTIEAIALASGYKSSTTFNKYFKMYKGCNPDAYRAKIEKE